MVSASNSRRKEDTASARLISTSATPPLPGTRSGAFSVHKALYGLKQSAHEWNTTMTKLFDKGHLTPMKSDPACYIGENIRVATHVDDYLILTRSGDDLVERTQALEQC